MKILCVCLGIIIGIYLGANYPDIAQVIWDMTMDVFEMAKGYINGAR